MMFCFVFYFSFADSYESCEKFASLDDVVRLWQRDSEFGQMFAGRTWRLLLPADVGKLLQVLQCSFFWRFWMAVLFCFFLKKSF